MEMGKYFGLFFQGLFTGEFWQERLESFRQLISKPGNYFAALGKKDNATGAYLLGMASTFVGIVVGVVVHILLFGLFSLKYALLSLPITLIIDLVGWVGGLYLLYFVGTWIYGLALKWVAQKDGTEKIRPILFACSMVGVAGVVPFAGGLVALVAYVVLMVVAYETTFKVERGPAIGSALVGMVLFGVAMIIPFLLLGALTTLVWRIVS